ncbi:dienelactone hydrolase family protein [Roseivirga thermotolerans]|uniref:dienelactone hydrolase family protein n=1 Tax=Roseivirga thermotolerans TaxID=1758176 RepID=UPI00273F40DE|nr:dienelactone hydrolase family protein [Roseivirga thermotolerans]
MKSIKTILFSLLLVVLVSCNEKPSSGNDSVSDMVGQEVSYSTETTEMKGYIAYNKSSKERRPGVIVVHEWWGHNEYVRSRADELARLGYVALAVDMYGEGKQAEHPDDAGKFAGEVMSNLEEAKARFDAALVTLKSNPNVDPDRIAAIGYCFGGSVVLSMANAGYNLDAVAAFHSGVDLPIKPTKDIKAKILVANGADDPFVPASSVARFRAAMDSVGADYKYVAYDGAVHAFTSPGANALGEKFNLPLMYNEDADKASWNELMSLFNEVFDEER